MYISKPSDISIGQRIYSAFDDRPIEGCGIQVGIVTEIFDDHYLFTETELGIENVWGDYDTEPCSVANYTTREEAERYLKIGYGNMETMLF